MQMPETFTIAGQQIEASVAPARAGCQVTQPGVKVGTLQRLAHQFAPAGCSGDSFECGVAYVGYRREASAPVNRQPATASFEVTPANNVGGIAPGAQRCGGTLVEF